MLVGVSVRVEFADLKKRLQALAARLRNPRPVLEAIAERLFLAARGAFEKQTSPEGQRWAPLSSAYELQKMAVRRFSMKNILMRTGHLHRTLHRGVEGGAAFASTADIAYAAAHQFGSRHWIPETRPREKRALRFVVASGQTIFARRARGHFVSIPARPFLPSPETAAEIAVEEVEAGLKREFDQ